MNILIRYIFPHINKLLFSPMLMLSLTNFDRFGGEIPKLMVIIGYDSVSFRA